MRVIAGRAGGMRLEAPHGNKTRPTSDRVKEALFSILDSAEMLVEKRVLDLFAGTGALGIEALSRGALSAVFVENSRTVAAIIKKNLEHSGLYAQSQVVVADAYKSLERFVRDDVSFDLIFLDPPYRADQYIICMELISSKILNRGGVLVVELSAKDLLPASLGELVRYDRRSYGDTALEFFRHGETDVP